MKSFLDALGTALTIGLAFFAVVAWSQVLVWWWRNRRNRRRRPQQTLADELSREGHRWTGEPGRWSVGETTREGEGE